MGDAAAVPWARDAVTAAHFGLFESRREMAPLRAISLLNIKRKEISYILKLCFDICKHTESTFTTVDRPMKIMKGGGKSFSAFPGCRKSFYLKFLTFIRTK